jgi:hypothetical protein
LAPSLTVYFDVANFSGAYYASLGVSHSVALSETLALDLGLSLGYADDGDTYNELHDGVVSVALPIAVNDFFTITPELYASFALSSDAEDLLEAANLEVIEEKDSTFVYGGISLNVAF